MVDLTSSGLPNPRDFPSDLDKVSSGKDPQKDAVYRSVGDGEPGDLLMLDLLSALNRGHLVSTPDGGLGYETNLGLMVDALQGHELGSGAIGLIPRGAHDVAAAMPADLPNPPDFGPLIEGAGHAISITGHAVGESGATVVSCGQGFCHCLCCILSSCPCPSN